MYAIPQDRLTTSSRRFSNWRPGKRAVSWHGLPLKIEIEAGDVKSGYGEGGEYWEHTYEVPYGEVPGSRALSDGDGVDVYLGPAAGATLVYVIHQLKRDGSFDEDKCMLDFASQGDAVLAYRRHGPPWGIGGVDSMTADQFVRGYLASNRNI